MARKRAPAKAKSRALAPRRARFIDEYLVDQNATQAAIRAGYSPKVANREGSRLLSNADIRAAITERQQARSDRLQLNGDRILGEFSRIADSDLRNYVDWGPDGVRLKPSSELTEDQARAVMQVTEKRRTIPQRGEDAEPIVEVEVSFKLHPKVAALDSLAKAHGLFAKDAAAKQLDTLLEVMLLILRRYVAPERIERAINDFGTLVDDATRGETQLPAKVA